MRQRELTQPLRWEPEIELLLRCARLQLSAEESAAISAQLESGVDKQRFLGLVRHHRLIPLVYQHLTAVDGESIAPDLMTALKAAHQQTVLRGLQQLAALRRIVACLNSAGIPVMPLKGVVLARQLYGDAALRQSGDVDIMVPPDQVYPAIAALKTLGYQPKHPFNLIDDRSRLGRRLIGDMQEIPLVKPGTKEPVLDLHRFLAHEINGTTNTLWRSAVTTEFDGFPVHTLSPEWLMLFLCYHGSWHLFGRLHWLCDIDILARSTDRWESTEAIARQIGVQASLGLALMAAQRLLGSPIPPVSHDTLESGERLLPLLVNNLKRWTPVTVSQGFRMLLIAFFIHNGGLKGAHVATRNLMRPNISDFVPLSHFAPLNDSEQFYRLAYLIRPFRLALKYTLPKFRSWKL